MVDPILSTKLFIPQIRSELVPRPELIKVLENGVKHKLTLISAPAGYGKTTLVSIWAKLSGYNVSWLSLDEGDSDPVKFLNYIIASLQTIFPGLGKNIQGILRSGNISALKSILSLFINEITAKQNKFILVLDDYHLINSSRIDDSIAYLLEHLPPSMHLIIITRKDPSLPLGRLRVKNQLTEIRSSDLQFKSDEIDLFFTNVIKRKLQTEELDILGQYTEGWVAGLQLAAISLKGQKDIGGFLQNFNGKNYLVFDYLVEEVLEKQSDEVESFLMRTSIFDRFCGPLYDTIFPDDSISGQEIIEYLERANLFIIPLDKERNWYRYHHLFADLLRKKFHYKFVNSGKNFDEMVKEIHKKASIWYEKEDMEVEAFKHAARAGDIERAESLIDGKNIPLHFRGAVQPVLKWLETLPESEMNNRPSLWVKYASVLAITGQVERTKEVICSAEKVLDWDDKGDKYIKNLIGHTTAIKAFLAAAANRISDVIDLSEKALELSSRESGCSLFYYLEDGLCLSTSGKPSGCQTGIY